MTRLLSISAGVHPDLSPADMVSAAASAGWPACGIWFDGDTWSDRTTNEVRRRLDDTGIVALDVEPIIPADGSDDHAARLVEAAARLGARFVLFTSRLKDHGATAARYAEVCAMAEPHGITVVAHRGLGLGPALAGQKGPQRRVLLERCGVHTAQLRGIDWIDAALCALAAQRLADGAPCRVYGAAASGVVLLPSEAAW